MPNLKFDDHLPFPKDYPRVRISKDMEVSSPLGIRLSGAANAETLPFDLEATVEVVDGRFAITSMTLQRVENGPPVGAGQLSRLRIWDFINGAIFVSNSLVYKEIALPGIPGKFITAEASASETWQHELDSLRELDTPRADLAGLARFYKLSRLGFYDPTETVAAALGVNSSTVRRWLAEAVAIGELTQEERRK